MKEEDSQQSVGREKIRLPDAPDIPDAGYDLDRISEELESSSQLSDYSDMEAIHTQIKAARLSLYHTIKAQSQADTESMIAEQKYKRVWNRVYVSSTGTDKIRSTMADIKSESYQNEFLVAQIKFRELTRRAQFLRDELRSLESLSNDYRQIVRSQR